MFRCSTGSIVLLCSMTALGCGGGGGTTCTRDDECASQFCKADGTCGPIEVDASTAIDAPSDATSGVCAPDHDGMISLAELPLIAGRMATFRVATSATFNTAGTVSGAGTRSWDVSGQLSNDTDRPIVLLAPAGTWWQASFPTATYAAPLSASSDLLGVFTVSATAVSLLGVVSPAAGTFRTELTYAPPAKILALPIAAGGTWTTTSAVTGTAQGSFVTYSEQYASLVDQVGTIKTPYGEFPVVRVATDLTRTSGLATLLTKRSFAWIAECFGSVATVSSQDFEASAEFSNPAEVRRLTP